MAAILESGEMYLEDILILKNKIGVVRAIDVANYMGFSRPSVSRALGILKNNGFVTVDKAGDISLTEEGQRIAEKIYERHTVLADFFERLGVDRKTAVSDACKIEHDISDETFEKIKEHAAKFGNKL